MSVVCDRTPYPLKFVLFKKRKEKKERQTKNIKYIEGIEEENEQKSIYVYTYILYIISGEEIPRAENAKLAEKKNTQRNIKLNIGDRDSFVSFLFLCALAHRIPFENRNSYSIEINYILRMITVSWFLLPTVYSGSQIHRSLLRSLSVHARGPNKV